MATTETNINELIELLGISEELLRTNTIIENEITKHGGKVVYSFNDVIIASEISDETYNELQKNPFIDSIYEMPLKRYGEIDINLIDQLDVSKLPKNVSANNSSSGSSGTSGTPGYTTGDPPVITNTILTLTANTNEWFEYNVTATGLLPIKFDIIPNISEPISINGSLIKGFSAKEGNFDIIITATNSVSVDSKTLTIQVGQKPKITSALFMTASKDKPFSYEITSSGTASATVPKTYVAVNLPSGLYINENIISGIPLLTGTSNIVLGVINSYGSDSKTLVLTVGGNKPIITSASSKSVEEYSDFNHKIIASGDIPITFSVIGTLPEGLTFAIDTISGTPTAPGVKKVKLKAINAYGYNEQDYTITITNMHGGGGGGL
jgi:hypothetical protein